MEDGGSGDERWEMGEQGTKTHSGDRESEKEMGDSGIFFNFFFIWFKVMINTLEMTNETMD